MLEALVIDASALDRLQNGFDFDVDWFRAWSADALPPDVLRAEVGEVVYLLGPDADAGSKLLVIDLATSGLFGDLQAKHRPEVFLRLVRAARSAHAPGRLPVPTSWSPFHAGSLFSFQSNHLATGEKARIEIDLNPRSTPHAFVFQLDRTRRDLTQVSVPYNSFDKAIAGFEDSDTGQYLTEMFGGS